jgi:hypothetical protein
MRAPASFELGVDRGTSLTTLLDRRPTTVFATTHIENTAPTSHIQVISMALPGAVALRMTINPQPTGFDCRLPTSLPKLISRSSPMADKKNNAPADAQAYQPVPFAKKHRISVEDATAILRKHGADRKSADKEARRVAV